MNASTTTYARGIALLNAHPARASADISAVLNPRSAFGFVEKTAQAFDRFGIDADIVFSLPQKQVKRAVQMVNAVVSGTYDKIDATTACGLYALRLSPDNALEYDALHLLISGVVRKEDSLIDQKGVSRSILRRLFARVGANTVSTQKSRSFGNNGFCDALGMTGATHGKVNRMVDLNPAHPLTVAFFEMVDKANPAQIDAIGGGKGE
jgi:hypothetical protein